MASRKDRSRKVGSKRLYPGLPGPKTLDLVDLFIFLLDSRIPRTSLELSEPYLRRRRRVYVMSKSDLADPDITEKWIDYFRKDGFPCFAVDANTGLGVSELASFLKRNREEMNRRSDEEFEKKPLRVMLFGLPNVGKSSLANRLLRTSKASFGAKPGLTRSSYWLRADHSVEILDTPGVIDTSQVKGETLYKLAATWAVSENQYDPGEVALWLAKEVFHAESPLEYLTEFGLSRGMLASGGVVDINRACTALIQQFRTGGLGRISLEKPGLNG